MHGGNFGKCDNRKEPLLTYKEYNGIKQFSVGGHVTIVTLLQAASMSIWTSTVHTVNIYVSEHNSKNIISVRLPYKLKSYRN